MSTPTTPGPCIIIVDCPSLEYLPALQAQQDLQQLQQECQQQQQQVKKEEGGDGSAAAVAGEGSGQNGSSSGGEAAPRKRFIVIHMGPAVVSRSAEYRAWCAGFGSEADQMFLSRESQLCTTTLRAAQLQAQLNVIEPEVFPLQGFLDLKQQQQQQQGAVEGAGSVPAAAAAGSQGMDCPDGLVFTLVPARQQGITLDTAITQAPDFEAVQVRGLFWAVSGFFGWGTRNPVFAPQRSQCYCVACIWSAVGNIKVRQCVAVATALKPAKASAVLDSSAARFQAGPSANCSPGAHGSLDAPW
jgi:hypothetical protein